MLALLIESWIWWGLVIVVAASRFVSRRMVLGSFKNYQADDYLMMVALCFYTTLIATINIVRDTSSNLLPPGFDVNSLTKQEIHKRQYGSKLILVVEQCQCATIWLVKGCLIILYLRLTTARRENLAIKALGVYVVLSFIVMDSLYFGYWCQPFHNYWAVPTPNKQCDAATNHLIMNAVFNLTSDCATLAIGLPMFLRLNLPWKKKIPVIMIFSLGIFTIVAAILNKVYSFTRPFGAQWTYWYTRESSTALLVANLPFLWTVLRKILGTESVQGQSRQDSLSPNAALSRTNTNTVGTASEGKAKSPTTDKLWFRSDSLAELEMDEVPRARGMTLDEILRDDPPPTSEENEPTELTHPHLFWTRRKNGLSEYQKPSMEKAVLSDKSEPQQVVRRSSSLEGDGQPGYTPASSVFHNLDDKTSANSLV